MSVVTCSRPLSTNVAANDCSKSAVASAYEIIDGIHLAADKQVSQPHIDRVQLQIQIGRSAQKVCRGAAYWTDAIPGNA